MADNDDLPSEVDVVVLGTGLQESILAAACARAGLSVLHVDRNPFYGGCWGSGFNFRSLEDWLTAVENTTEESPCSYEPSEEELVVPAAASQSTIRNLVLKSDITTEDNPENKENASKVVVSARRFNMDLIPKLLLSDGPMVKILRQSEASKYCEFKCVDRFLCLEADVSKDPLKMFKVPCTKSEISFTRMLSPIEKRMLYKFLDFCLTWSTNRGDVDKKFPEYKWEDYAEKPFTEFLDTVRIKGVLKNIVVEIICILKQEATTLEGLQATSDFLGSMGHLGNLPTPFVYTLYGSSDLEQSFNRLCAVYGGVYCLDRPCEAFVLDKTTNKCVAVISGGQKIQCKHVITSQDYIHKKFDRAPEKTLMKRCMLLADGSVVPSEEDHITLMGLNRLHPAVRFLETGYSAGVTSKGFYFAHLTSQGSESHSATFSPIVERLYHGEENRLEGDTRPRVCWSLMFDVVQRSFESPAENIGVVPAPDFAPDFSSVISSAEEMFQRYWPMLDFLPRKAHTTSDESDEELAQEVVEEQTAETP
uniref:Rab proteins geranylgeranyltransferase component A n=1 Tax=Steinernema glaseri TaxID=37863 RepID=A0A1I7Y7W4_9BILA